MKLKVIFCQIEYMCKKNKCKETLVMNAETITDTNVRMIKCQKIASSSQKFALWGTSRKAVVVKIGLERIYNYGLRWQKRKAYFLTTAFSIRKF